MTEMLDPQGGVSVEDLIHLSEKQKSPVHQQPHPTTGNVKSPRTTAATTANTSNINSNSSSSTAKKPSPVRIATAGNDKNGTTASNQSKGVKNAKDKKQSAVSTATTGTTAAAPAGFLGTDPSLLIPGPLAGQLSKSKNYVESTGTKH